jgi:hypothetical protein
VGTKVKAPQSLVIAVSRPDDAAEPITVSGVAAQLILSILSHADEIGSYDRGQVQLDFGPGGVAGRLHPLWEQTIDPAILAHFSPSSAVATRVAKSKKTRATTPVEREAVVIAGNEQPPWPE